MGKVAHGEWLQDLAGERTPQADAAPVARDVLHLHLTGRQTEHPVELERTVRHHLEPVLGVARHGGVGQDAAPVVQHQGVGDGTDRLSHVLGGQVLRKSIAPGPVTSRCSRSVMSYIATAERVACASAAATGDH